MEKIETDLVKEENFEHFEHFKLNLIIAQDTNECREGLKIELTRESKKMTEHNF